MKTPDEFIAFYNETLYPQLEPLEAERQQVAIKVAVVVGVIAFIAFCIIAIILLVPWVEQDSRFQLAGFVGLLAFLGAGGAYALLTRTYVSNFKNIVMTNLVQFINPNLAYDAHHHVSIEDYTQSGLFKRSYDRYQGDDHVTGLIGQTHIEFSELHTEYKTVSHRKGRRRETWHTIFRGLFFMADFHKEFKGVTYVLPDKAESLFGSMGSLLQSHNKSHGELMKMDDPEFEKAFVVYGTDPIEARYILSNSLMKRIIDFKKKRPHSLHIGFINSRMIIALSYPRPLFEPNLYKSLLEFEEINAFLEDLMLAIGLVEDMNLNTRIWTKK